MYFFSTKTVEQVREMYQWYLQVKGMLKPQFRRRNIGSGGGTRVRIAYCATDAPDSDEIACYLDRDAEGDTVTVKCQIANGSSLMYATPYLKDGDPIIVHNISGEWTAGGFNGAEFVT